jgi:Flp pilus assembly protein TadG
MALTHALVKDTRGAIYVEFLIAFIPVFTMFLGVVQATLMYSANLVVSHEPSLQR